jgi:sulfite exporter TauE/SafE
MKTVVITVLCGIGHVGSSIVLGLIGIAAGIGVSKLESVESQRGIIASWIIIVFGLAYLIWGLYHARKHRHHHHHILGHNHSSSSSDDGISKKTTNITPWVLFIIFVFGPCEPLIPLFIYPAAQHSVYGVAAVSIVFSVVTLITMLTIVTLSFKGLKLIKFPFFERYTHAIAGATIMICGLGIVFLGL